MGDVLHQALLRISHFSMRMQIWSPIASLEDLRKKGFVAIQALISSPPKSMRFWTWLITLAFMKPSRMVLTTMYQTWYVGIFGSWPHLMVRSQDKSSVHTLTSFQIRSSSFITPIWTDCGGHGSKKALPSDWQSMPAQREAIRHRQHHWTIRSQWSALLGMLQCQISSILWGAICATLTEEYLTGWADAGMVFSSNATIAQRNFYISRVRVWLDGTEWRRLS